MFFFIWYQFIYIYFMFLYVHLISVIIVSFLSKYSQSSSHNFSMMDPDSKVHVANTELTWVLSAPDEPHVGHMNLAIWGDIYAACSVHLESDLFTTFVIVLDLDTTPPPLPCKSIEGAAQIVLWLVSSIESVSVREILLHLSHSCFQVL